MKSSRCGGKLALKAVGKEGGAGGELLRFMMMIMMMMMIMIMIMMMT
jgi:hypothetical protein